MTERGEHLRLAKPGSGRADDPERTRAVEEGLVAAVQSSPWPMALIELPSGRFVAYSHRAENVFGPGYWDMAGAERLAVGVLVADVTDETSLTVPDIEGQLLSGASRASVAVVTLSEEWIVECVSGEITSLLGYEVAGARGTPLLGLVHPQDAGDLLAFASRAQTTDKGMTYRLRLRAVDESWRLCQALIVVLHGIDSRSIGLVLASNRAEIVAGREAAGRVCGPLATGCRRGQRSRRTEPVGQGAQPVSAG